MGSAWRRSWPSGPVADRLAAEVAEQRRRLAAGAEPFEGAAAAALAELTEQDLQIKQAQCARVRVSSGELPWYNGEYTVLPEEHNGCRVWGGPYDHVIYKDTEGRWRIVWDRNCTKHNWGRLATDPSADPFPFVPGGWNSARDNVGEDLVPAPRTTVTAAAT
eukprot:TRINITY_DN9744_c0_g1_i12.p1 TRINITY_DN9744_c0_g1~~TRINITY_DN9744_c0_g1_i12.p1  ORF type:complete len:162 (+),score=25.78 TRINITY_DN9744_c0_g1_i12:145-630(+)